MPDLGAILNEALPRWAKLTDTKLGATEFTLYPFRDSEFQEHDLVEYIKELNETRTLDPEGTTTLLLLRGLFAAYVEEQSFSAKALLADPKTADARLVELRAFHTLLHQPLCDTAIAHFQEALRGATTHYGYDATRLDGLFSDELRLGQLRRDALRSLKRLRVHQFAQGPLDAEPLRYNPTVYEFWNVNSLLMALRKQWVSGITMALIRNPADVYQSYFVLGLRNGATITVLTDFEEGAHPDYYKMTRRPDRRLDERASRHWFPYQFLTDTNGDDERLKHDDALVPMNTEAVPIGDLSALEPEQFVWTALLFELVARRFGEEGYRTRELSYTGQMVVEPHALVEASSALVAAGQYRPLELPRLTIETVTGKAAGTRKAVGHNAWMEERYAKRVPVVLLDVVGQRAALAATEKALKRLPPPADFDNIQPAWKTEPEDVPLSLRALDPTSFGTRKTLAKNRTWAARTNLMQGIQRLAEADYAKNRNRIQTWYRERVEKNIDALLDAAARGEFPAPTAEWKSRRDHGFPSHDELLWSDENILRQYTGRTLYHAFPGECYSSGVRLGKLDQRTSKMACYVCPPTGATVFTIFRPNNPQALAQLAGVAVAKLPWPLQHWYANEPYTGNSILDRVDPSDWVLDNPWRRLSFDVTLALCKRAWRARRKMLDLDPRVPLPPTRD